MSISVDTQLASAPIAARTAVPATAPTRVFELDLLRGVAILLVLGVHSPTERGEAGPLRALDLFLHEFGWTGVDLFFVLSGFLIGGLLFAEIKRDSRINVGRFLVRRIFRIWPAYYLLLLYVFVRIQLDSGFAQAWSQVWPSVVNLQNYLGAPREQLWSLAVEEHFYLLLPAGLWLALRQRARQDLWPVVVWSFAFVAVVCLGLRIVTYWGDPKGYRFQTHLRMDSLFFGVLLAHLHAFRPHVLRAIAARRSMLLLGVLLLVPAAFKGAVRDTIGFTGLYLGYGLLMIMLVYRVPTPGPVTRWLDSTLARWTAVIGTSSYSIYLFHRDTLSWQAHQAASWAGKSLGLPSPVVWVLHTAAYIAASVLGGVVLGKLIETPALKLRDRLFPSTQRREPRPEPLGS